MLFIKSLKCAVDGNNILINKFNIPSYFQAAVACYMSNYLLRENHTGSIFFKYITLYRLSPLFVYTEFSTLTINTFAI